MKEKIEFKNTKLSFFSESSMSEYSSPVGEYLKEFPFENYDLDKIYSRPEEMSTLMEELNHYLESHIVRFQFPSGYISMGYNSSPKIWIDDERLDQLKNGFIPVWLWFFDPYIPSSKGYFSWES